MARSDRPTGTRIDGDMPRDRKLDAASVLAALGDGTDKATLQHYFSAFEWRKIADVLAKLVDEGKEEATTDGWRPVGGSGA